MSTDFCENYSAFNEKLSVVRADHHLKEEPTHFSQTEDLKKSLLPKQLYRHPCLFSPFRKFKVLRKS